MIILVLKWGLGLDRLAEYRTQCGLWRKRWTKLVELAVTLRDETLQKCSSAVGVTKAVDHCGEYLHCSTAWITLRWKPGAQPRGGGPGCCLPTPQNQNKKNRFYRYDDIKHFPWFTLQPKSATEILLNYCAIFYSLIYSRTKEERNILQTIKRRKANWIGHFLRRNCLLKHVIEGKIKGKIEVTERRGRRREQLLDDLKETRRYWKLKEETRDRTLWRTRFRSGYGPVVRQTTERMNEYTRTYNLQMLPRAA
jgi:hypothetical protein